MLLDEMMHKVGTRHRQESKECQDSTKHAKAASSPAHLSLHHCLRHAQKVLIAVQCSRTMCCLSQDDGSANGPF